MLQIREEQMALFESSAEDGFMQRLLHHLHTNHPEQVDGLSQQALRARAQYGVEVARGYGVHGEAALTAFVALMFVVSPDFHTQPAINRVLEEMRFTPEQNFDDLFARTDDKDWEQAAKLGGTFPGA